METRDFQMRRGDTLIFDVFAKRPDPSPLVDVLETIDLTGGKAWFTAKRTISEPDENADIRLSTSLGGVAILNPTAGQVRTTVPPAKTTALPDDVVTFDYDVQVMDAAGVVTTVQAGRLFISPDVTRAIS